MAGPETGEVQRIARVRLGDRDALAAAFAEHRPRLLRSATLRMDPRLAARVSPEDVLQEAYVSAAQRCSHVEGDSEAALFLWLRLVTLQTLIDLHRRHVGTQARSVEREAGRPTAADSGATVNWGIGLPGSVTSPTEVMRRGERSERLRGAIDGLSALDREILLLRHFEELSNQEVATVLKIEQKAASIRYFRALTRLRKVLEGLGNDSTLVAQQRGPGDG
jgi:RNA polymerase sigma-70 factor (ECF subfamily)